MKITIISTNRSDVGLLRPIEVEAARRGHTVDWSDGSFPYIYKGNYDWAICGFDRREMVPIAHKLFNAGIRIAQPAAGDVRVGGGDERHRWAISVYAHLLMPWSRPAEERCWNFASTINLLTAIQGTGPTTWDHVVPVPLKEPPFDLVLLNPPVSETDMDEVKKLLGDRRTIWLPPCDPDELIYRRVNWDPVSHAMFLGLLKTCRRFITNSSSGWYAAPKVLEPEQIVRIGRRNAWSDPPEFQPDNQASRLTVDALEKYLCLTSFECEKATICC